MCSAGTYYPTTGAVDQTSCRTCPSGAYCPTGSVNPINCSAGTFNPGTGALNSFYCAACPAGEYCPVGTTLPISCSGGTYRGTTNGTQQGDCTTCPSGNYCPAGAVNPTNCSAGYYNPSTGSSAVAACLTCPQADFCPIATTTPSQCAANTYSLGGAPTCSACPSFSTSAVASINCTCNNGHYQVGSVTGSGATAAVTVTGMDTYLGIFPGFGANDLSFLTFNGYNNISILQGTVVTLTSAPYGTPTPAQFGMNIYSNLAYKVNIALQSTGNLNMVDYVALTPYAAGCSSYLYSKGVSGAGSPTVTWNTSGVPSGLYYLMATSGGSGGEQYSASMFVASPTPVTLSFPVPTPVTYVVAFACFGDTLVLYASPTISGTSTVYLWKDPASDTTGSSQTLVTSGPSPLTWNSASASPQTQYYVADSTGATFSLISTFIVLVNRPSPPSSASTLTCPNCSSGTYSLAGNTACTNCGYGSYSAAVSSACTTCPVGTMCNSVTTPAPVNCGQGNYQGSTGQSFCLTCPANQYCSSATTQTPASCPAHTFSANGSYSLLQCECVPGYNCAYKKQITAVVTLNTTLYNFNNNVNGVQTAFLQAVAAAAGVSPSQVVVNTVVSSTGNRRLLSEKSNKFIDVYASVRGAERLHRLDAHLARHSLTLHKGHSWQEAHSLTAVPMVAE